MFFGVNLTFFPMHFLGLAGIPRRYSDYPDAYSTWNLVARSGSLISIVSVLYFLMIIWEAMVSHRSLIRSKSLNSSLELAHS